MNKRTVTMSYKEQQFSLWYLLFYFLCLPSLLVLGNQQLPKPIPTVLLNTLSSAISFVCLILICRRFLWESVKRAFKKPAEILSYAIMGLAIYRVSIRVVDLCAQQIMPGFANVNDQTILDALRLYPVLISAGLVLLVPLVEEILFRGLIFASLCNRSSVSAYLVSTLAFSAIHITGYIGQYGAAQLILCFVQYLPAGICLAWIYQKTDNIFTSILMHTLVNLIGVLTLR